MQIETLFPIFFVVAGCYFCIVNILTALETKAIFTTKNEKIASNFCFCVLASFIASGLLLLLGIILKNTPSEKWPLLALGISLCFALHFLTRYTHATFKKISIKKTILH